MYYNIIRPIIMGILLGLAVFIMPFFILKVIAFFMIAGLLIRFFIFRRIRRFFKGQMFFSGFADEIRNMEDIDYQKFKQRFKRHPHSAAYARFKNGETIEVEIK